MVSALALRSESAWALPRPSAMASAKLANSTVNHSQAATRPANQFSLELDDPRSRKKRMVVSTEPTSTTIITGFLAIWRGSSLMKLSTDGPPHDGPVEQALLLLLARGGGPVSAGFGVRLIGFVDVDDGGHRPRS